MPVEPRKRRDIVRTLFPIYPELGTIITHFCRRFSRRSLIPKGVYGIGGGRLDGFETHGDGRDDHGRPPGKEENPYIHPGPAGKIVEPLPHGKIGDGPGGQVEDGVTTPPAVRPRGRERVNEGTVFPDDSNETAHSRRNLKSRG